MSQNKLWVSYVGVAEIEKKRLNVEKNLSLGLAIVVRINFFDRNY